MVKMGGMPLEQFEGMLEMADPDNKGYIDLSNLAGKLSPRGTS